MSDAPKLGHGSSKFLASAWGDSLARALPEAQLEPYPAAQVSFAVVAWRLRAEEEYRSAAIFAELLAAIVDAALPLELCGVVAGVVSDELRHAELCCALAERFGAAAPRADTDGVRARVSGRTDRRLLALSILLIEGAIGETLSSALFNAGRHATREPCARAALQRILRDEARHARIFWEALDTVRLSDTERGVLARELAAALGALERHQALPALKRLEAGERFDPGLGALGVLDPEKRVDAFYRTLENVVLPRLDRLGLDGQLAWRSRYRG